MGIPVVHLDRHHWKPGWTPTASKEWTTLQANLVAGERWVIDGNYGGTFDIRFERADTVVVLALSRSRCLARALRRTIRNWGRAIQADDCPERVDLAFLRWIWRYPLDSRPRLDAAIERHRGHLRVVELTSPRKVKEFLNDLG
jgi:adenylate kinase family enzyme